MVRWTTQLDQILIVLVLKIYKIELDTERVLDLWPEKLKKPKRSAIQERIEKLKRLDIWNDTEEGLRANQTPSSSTTSITESSTSSPSTTHVSVIRKSNSRLGQQKIRQRSAKPRLEEMQGPPSIDVNGKKVLAATGRVTDDSEETEKGGRPKKKRKTATEGKISKDAPLQETKPAEDTTGTIAVAPKNIPDGSRDGPLTSTVPTQNHLFNLYGPRTSMPTSDFDTQFIDWQDSDNALRSIPNFAEELNAGLSFSNPEHLYGLMPSSNLGIPHPTSGYWSCPSQQPNRGMEQLGNVPNLDRALPIHPVPIVANPITNSRSSQDSDHRANGMSQSLRPDVARIGDYDASEFFYIEETQGSEHNV